jgi:hypothetical protein
MSEVKQEGDFKIKSKTPRKFSNNDEVTKVNLDAPVEDVTKVVIDEDKSDEQVTELDINTSSEIAEDGKEPQVTEDTEGVLQEISNEEVQEQAEDLKEDVQEAIAKQESTGVRLPENIEKVVNFMNETGGTLQDYVRLSADYSTIDNSALLREYYAKTKPYLEGEDISLILEDFSYDEELDEERDIRKKKIAYKEEIAKAKDYLEGLKGKYYDEIKLRPGVTQDQQKATDFFNRYNEEQQANVQVRDKFLQDTNSYFTNEFKGFDFNVGEKKFRYGVKDSSTVMDQQNDLTQVIGKFLDSDGNVKNQSQYHKAIFAARNADTIAQHFYEQGKADAVRNITAKSNNVSGDVRQSAPDSVFVNGFSVKAINGVDSSRLKIRKK